MEFNLEVPQDQFFVRSISERGIRVSDNYFNNPFILSGQKLVSEWDVTTIDDINESSLQVVFDMQPEVVLVGTGETQVFLPVLVQRLFFQRSIGFEVMTTDAACRTFNILVAEGRHVVAALLI